MKDTRETEKSTFY